MLRIYHYLALSSAILIVLAMVAVAVIYRSYAVEDLVEAAEDHNIALAKTLSKAVGVDLVAYVESTEGLDRAALQARPEVRAHDDVLGPLTQNLHIVKIKIYDAQGRTIYSSVHDEIGELKKDRFFFDRLIKLGEEKSELSRRDNFSAFSGELFDRDIIESYIPIGDPNTAIVGAFEIYSDVTEITDRADRAVLVMIVALSAIFVALYGSLSLYVMRRAVRPLHRASRKAMEIGPHSASRRMPVQGIPGEILPLVEAMNGALERLDNALIAQREFTADAAHELLTPLAVINAALEKLKDDEVAAEIRADIMRMSDSVTQLLELASLDGGGPLAETTVDVHEVCEEVIADMAPFAWSGGYTISLTGLDEPLLVRCSRPDLVKALRNLIKNAIQHSPPNGAVEVNLRSDGAVRVIDSGPGVPLANRSRIFERFWRTEKGDRPGAGLGLAIVKRFTETCDGTIDVGDAPGGGAVFMMRLPLANKDRDALRATDS